MVSVKQSKLVKILEEVKLVNLVSLVEQVMVAFKVVVETFSKTDPERVRASTSSPRLTCDYFKTL